MSEATGVQAFSVGDPVAKVGGDYRFDGTVIGVFTKLSGVVRYAVEDDRGVIHIYSAKNLVRRGGPVVEIITNAKTAAEYAEMRGRA